jgi:hypothetical protein
VHTDQIEDRNCQPIAHGLWMIEGEVAMRIFEARVRWQAGSLFEFGRRNANPHGLTT